MTKTSEISWGISVARYDSMNDHLLVRGWCVPRPDKVEISLFDCQGNVTVRKADLGYYRNDIAKKFGIDDYYAGWQWEADAHESSVDFASDHLVRVFRGGGIVDEQPIKFGHDLQRQRIQAHLNRHRLDKKSKGRSSVNVLRAAIQEHFGSDFIVYNTIDEAAFLQWTQRMDYNKNWPSYVKEFAENLSAKQAEHFVSIDLLEITPGGTYIDVAASNSPFSNILMQHYSPKHAYKQDLRYPGGLKENTIGSNASDIPLPSGSVDGIVAHNSWEHFEGESDISFIIECSRLLKVGGRLCIVPCNLGERTEVWTSLSVWATKYKNVTNPPEFDPRAIVVVNEEIRQRQIKIISPKDLAADLSYVPQIEFKAVVFQGHLSKRLGSALLGIKR